MVDPDFLSRARAELAAERSWNELRERRVLRAAEARWRSALRDRSKGPRSSWPRQRAAGIAVAALACATLAVVASRPRTTEPIAPDAVRIAPPAPSAPAAGPARTEREEPPAKSAPPAPAPRANPGEVDELLANANAARARGDLDHAATFLRAAIARHPDAARAAVALFALGRVERARGNARASAEAFGQCSALAPTDDLSDDASAESIESLALVAPAAARSRARDYLRKRPRGEHVERISELAR